MAQKAIDVVLSPLTLTIGQYTFSMKKFRVNAGHDDSLPYQGDLYINGKKAFECFNDGWGGMTCIRPVKGNPFNERELNAYLKEQHVVATEIYGITLHYDSVDFIADMIAEAHDERNFCKKQRKIGRATAYNPKTHEYSSARLSHPVLQQRLTEGYVLIYNEDGTEADYVEPQEKSKAC